ncbi:MAG TPA: hypothetical protein VM076_21155 [Gemmatimonadaceae bacterium]|nr:hypothetical protein [Gemmatimonadaceae bacterium]
MTRIHAARFRGVPPVDQSSEFELDLQRELPGAELALERAQLEGMHRGGGDAGA